MSFADGARSDVARGVLQSLEDDLVDRRLDAQSARKPALNAADVSNDLLRVVGAERDVIEKYIRS